jgi:uncharacterized protein YhaN
MQITKLEISGFGNFNQPVFLEFERDRIGLVLGKNETGKSTLVSAIFALFYGLKPSDKKKWQSWEHQKNFYIKLQFTHNDENYLLWRDLEKNLVRFERINEREKIIFNDYHLPSEKFDRIYFQAFENIFTLPAKSILESTSIIFENQLAVTADTYLRQQITGTVETDYEDVLSALEEEYYQITKERLPWQKYGGRKTSQLVEEKLQQLHDIENGIQEALQYFNNQRSVQQNLLATESQRKKIEQKIPIFHRLLIQIKQIERLQVKIDDLYGRKDEVIRQLESIEEIISQKNSLDQKIKDIYGVLLPFNILDLEKEVSKFLLYKKRENELRNRMEELQTETNMIKSEQQRLPDFEGAPDNFVFIVQEIQYRDDEIPKLKDQLNESNLQYDLKKKRFNGKIFLSIIWLCLAICAGILSWIFIPIEIWGWALSALTFFSGIFFTFAEVIPAFKKMRINRDESNEIQTLLNKAIESRTYNYDSVKKYLSDNFEESKTYYRRYKELQKRIDNTELLLDSTKSDINKILAEQEFKDYTRKYGELVGNRGDSLQEEIYNYRKDQNQLVVLTQKLEAFPDITQLREKRENLTQNISNLEFEKKSILKKYPVIEKLLAKSEINSLILKIEKESAEASGKLNQLEKQITAFRIHLHQNSSITYNPELLSQERTLLTEEISHLEKRKRALLCALEVLRESVNEFRNSHLDVLNKGIKKHLSKIIQPLKFGIKLDTEFQVNLTYKAKPISIDQLSSGSRDQLFFAYRLILNEILAPNINFPLIIDDAFVHFDQQRTKNIFGILKKLKKDHQIIILSSDERLKRRCEYVINLEEIKM